MKLCPDCHQCYEDIETACVIQAHQPLAFIHVGGRLIAGAYRLDSVLAEGSTGLVYAGTQLATERPVAIKLLLGAPGLGPRPLERFRREVDVASRLSHANIAAVLDSGVLPEGLPYIVMERVRGQSLRERLASRERMTLAEALDIARQLAAALEAAHREAVVHRDLTPGNTIITCNERGRLHVKVVDFGLARICNGEGREDTDLTITDTSVAGTPRYVAPEQHAGALGDARADIYAFGVILYEMLAGRPPFDGPTAVAIGMKQITEAPPALRMLRPEVSPSLAALVSSAMHVDPARRIQSAAEVCAALDAERRNLVSTLARGPAPSRPIERPRVVEQRRYVQRPRENEWRAADRPHAIESRMVRPPQPPLEAVRTPERPRPPTWPHAKLVSFAGALSAAALLALLAGGWLTLDRVPSAGVPASGNRSVPVQARSFERPSRSTPRLQRESIAPRLIAIGEPTLPAPTYEIEDAMESDQYAETTSDPGRYAVGDPAEVPAEVTDHEALVAALDEWVAATNAQDIDRQLDFYPATLDAFYLARDVPRAAVLAEKQRVFDDAEVVDIRTGEPQIAFEDEGREARMRFRKQYVIEGGRRDRRGEVVQELRWAKRDDGWKIVSERDLRVLR